MRRCRVVPAQGKLKSRRLLGSDRQDQFVERDRHPPAHWLLSASSSWPRRTLCTKAYPAMITLALRSCLSPRIGRSLAFSLPWSHSTRLLA